MTLQERMEKLDKEHEEEESRQAIERQKMREEARRAAEETHMSVLELFRSKEVRWQLISICLMMLSQQLSGKYFSHYRLN